MTEYRTIETDPASVQYVVDLLSNMRANRDGSLGVDMIMSLVAELDQLRSAANNGAPVGMIAVTWACAECGRNWTRAQRPGYTPRYCPTDASDCAAKAKKRHDSATSAERQKLYRARKAAKPVQEGNT